MCTECRKEISLISILEEKLGYMVDRKIFEANLSNDPYTDIRENLYEEFATFLIEQFKNRKEGK